MNRLRYLISCLLLVCCVSAVAEDRLIKVPTRPGVAVTLFWMPRDGASATVMLMPGGGGGFGKLVNGKPSGENFLVRSREYFAARGFNVAIFGKPSDRADLDYGYRSGDEHVDDMRQVVAALKQLSAQPVWIVGTSRGTISTAAAAIAFGNEQLAGIVLTSSVANRKNPGALPSQRLEAIRIPVLVFHHEKDACAPCQPDEVQWIMRGLSNAPLKKQLMVDGGAGPSGDPCEAHHWHGFIGMEKEAVDRISDWIKTPVQ